MTRSILLRMGMLLTLVLLASVVTGGAQSGDPQMRHSTRIESVAPNPYDPANGSTTITIALVKPGDVVVGVYSIDGSLIATLHQGPLTSGPHVVNWNGRDRDGSVVPSGTYLCRLQVGMISRAATIVVAR
jgi:flagellar hook assembly protein FlgD